MIQSIMTIYVRKRQGIEYIYLLAGKSQYYIGRKDDLDNLHLDNLYKATKIIDRNFDRMLSKYVSDMHEHARYMPEGERIRYLRGRLEKMTKMPGLNTPK